MRTTVKEIYARKKKGPKIAALTAYDCLMAGLLDRAGVDIILVGDSVGMVLLGLDTTVPVTMRAMLHHTRAAALGVRKALLVADMPFGAYATPRKAVLNAMRLMKEAGADAVKVEGGLRIRPQVEALVRAGIPVMGHVGMTPQTAGELGGYKVQGRGQKEAARILKEAELLDRLGVFCLVIECVPQALGRRITRRVRCPTLGIGAGPATDGQILVVYDMLGFDGKVRPKFVRRYAELGREIQAAAVKFRRDVENGRFPAQEESF
jgi:3-methyl-2-oxobutanoate hydroxymethyltransferase